MNRSGYTDDWDGDNNWGLICWRGAVASAIRGKRGQAFLKELAASLDALPAKRLIAHDLEKQGEVCAIGSVGKARGVEMDKLNVEDYDKIASTFGIPPALVREIEYENDEGWYDETPEKRWERVRKWVAKNIKP